MKRITNDILEKMLIAVEEAESRGDKIDELSFLTCPARQYCMK